MKKLLIIFLSLLFISSVFSQDIRRRGRLGFAGTPVSEEMIDSLNYPYDHGLEITRTVEGTTAENLDLKEGDILIELNGEKISDFGQVRAFAANCWQGDELNLKIYRDGGELELEGKIQPKPFETSEFAEVIYDTASFQQGYLRTITLKPEGEKLPAILFIPGYTCASYDGMGAVHPYKKLIDGWVKEGFVVFRIEKPGMGDCYNTIDCFDMDINTENEVFCRGFEKLASYDFVDKDNIFIFGHSMGGINAPYVAANYSPRGVIVYGTGLKSWYEYLIDMVRIQNPLMGIDWIEADREMRVYHELLYEHYVLRKHPKELADKDTTYKKLLERDFQYDGDEGIYARHYTYWQSICDLELYKLWSETDAYVLSIFGEADLQALSPKEHQNIAEVVNHYHPGKAEFYLMKETDHAFLKVGTMKKDAELYATGKIREYYTTHFNDEIITYTSEWIKKKMK